MPNVQPEIESFARIKVIGVGNSGGNSIAHMISEKVGGVEFIAIDSDAQKLHHNPASKKIHIGKNLTKGLGAGMNPEVGQQAAEETKEGIQETVKGADMVFIAGGLGGGTASGAVPIIAKIAKEQGVLTIAVVTKPFTFEGIQRMRISDAALAKLHDAVDTVIVIPNDRILAMEENNMTFLDAFKTCDEVLRQAVEGISDLITTPGIVNVDFADVRTIMKDTGSALMGIGISEGEHRASKAARMAINSPLLDLDIEGAKGVLFVISGGEDLTMHEIQEAAQTVTESIDSEARVIFGAINDDKLKKGEIKVTVIASGFPENKSMKKTPPVNNNLLDKEDEDTAKDAFPKKDKAIEALFESTGSSDKKKDGSRKNGDDVGDNGNDSWNSMPAFLRRKKNKE